MAVHPSSVIQLWVKDYYPAFYTAITDMEEYSYNIAGQFAFWQGQYTNLMSDMNAWKTTARSYVNNDYVRALHTCVVAKEVFSYTITPSVKMDLWEIFDMNAFIPDTLSRPVSWFSDYTALPSPNSPRMTAAIAQISTTGESTKVSAVETEALTQANIMLNNSLFVTPPMVTKTKEDLGGYEWLNLHLINVQQVLTTSITIPVPPYALPFPPP